MKKNFKYREKRKNEELGINKSLSKNGLISFTHKLLFTCPLFWWMAPASPRFIHTPGVYLHLPHHPAHIPQVSKACLSLKTIICSLSLLSSVAQSCLTLCNPMDCSTPGLPVHHQLLELTQTHVHRVGGAIQPSHPLSSPSPPAFNLSQNQGLFKWVSSSHQVAKILEFQLQHQCFQWIFRTDFL